MNQPTQLPVKGPPSFGKLIDDNFPEAYPMFWGANQKILEDGAYVKPTGFIPNRILIPPKVVRFIHDAHEERPESNCERPESGAPLSVTAFAERIVPENGERPWPGFFLYEGTWYPDATVWLAKPVDLIFEDDDGNEYLYDTIPVSQALAEGYIQYRSWFIQWYWMIDGIMVTSTEEVFDEPQISWSSDREHWLTTPSCSVYPTGCECIT